MDLPLIVAAEDTELLDSEVSIVLLLVVAAAVAVAVRRVRLPYTVALVVVGLGLAFLPADFIQIDVSSDLILAVLVPPLLFEATVHISWGRLKRDLAPVLLLALGGTLLGAFVVGGFVTALVDGVPWAAAVAFGALISATDPVAVIAFFRSIGVSKRLTILVEGESAVGIRLYGTQVLPMSEAKVEVSLDVSNRAYLVYDVKLANARIGSFDVMLTEDFLYAFSQSAGIDLHVELRYGRNPHHVVEAVFKGLARALRVAVERDPRVKGLPTVKGAL